MQNQSITSTESAVVQSEIANKIDFAVARKVLAAQKQQGQTAVDLVKQAAELQQQLATGQLDVQL